MNTTTTTQPKANIFESEYINRLKTVSRYARKIDRSVQRVYQLAKQDKVQMIEIDGVKFIVD